MYRCIENPAQDGNAAAHVLTVPFILSSRWECAAPGAARRRRHCWRRVSERLLGALWIAAGQPEARTERKACWRRLPGSGSGSGSVQTCATRWEGAGRHAARGAVPVLSGVRTGRSLWSTQQLGGKKLMNDHPQVPLRWGSPAAPCEFSSRPQKTRPREEFRTFKPSPEPGVEAGESGLVPVAGAWKRTLKMEKRD